MIPIQALVALVAVVAATLGALGGWSLRDTAADAEIAELKQAHAEAVAEWERSSRASAEAQREKERLLRKVVDREIEDANKDTAAVASRAAALRVAAERLRQHITRLAAATHQAGGDTAVADLGQAAAGPGLVPAELYRSADQEAVELAVAYDAARASGLRCERVYEAVRLTQ